MAMVCQVKCFVLVVAISLFGVQESAGGDGCVLDPPLPEEISNTEVTPEGKEAFASYMQCLQNECKDMDPVIVKALGKGIPGHAVDCADAKEKFTCELDTVPFWEVIGDRIEPQLVTVNCLETCEQCGVAPSSGTPPKAVAPKPSPRPAPKPKPAPLPAPTDAPKEDSATDTAAWSMLNIPPFALFVIFLATISN